MASSTVNSPDRGAASSSKLSPPSHRIEEIKIPVPWGHIAVKNWNDPSGKPLIAIHGTQDNAGSFNRLIPLLPSSYYYVCVDLPGHGLSSHFPKGFILDFLDYIMVISRVAQYFQWDKFTLMGHSLGGHLVSFYTGLFPDKVRKVVMLDAISAFAIPMPLYLEAVKNISDFMFDLEENTSTPPSYTYEEVVDRVMTKRGSKIGETGAKELIRRNFTQGHRGLTFSGDRRLKVNIFPLMTVDQVLDVDRQIRCPQLIILTKYLQNRLDEEIFKKAFALYKTRSNVTYEYIDGDHDVHIETPEVIASIVNKFLLKKKSLL